VLAVVAIRLAMEEAQTSLHFARQPQRNVEPGAHTGATNEAAAFVVRRDLLANVADDGEVHVILDFVVSERKQLGADLDAPCERNDTDGAALQVQLREVHQIVRQDGLELGGDSLKDLAHVERSGQRAQQILYSIQTLTTAALRVPDPPVLDGRAEQR